MEEFSHRLVERAGRLYGQEDLYAYRNLVSEAVGEVDSIHRFMKSLRVPSDYRRTHNMLLKFLTAYSSYLSGLGRGLDGVLEDQAEENLDIEGLKEEARQLLQDYQDAQEYNGASLDMEIWNLPQKLAEEVHNIYGEEREFPLGRVTGLVFPEEVVAYWYDYFNQGNVEAMYDLLSPYSSLPEDLGYEGMLRDVNRAREGGLEITYTILGTERIQENDMEKAVVWVRVEYSEHFNPETGEKFASTTEEVSFQLDLVDNIWYVDSISGSSNIW